MWGILIKTRNKAPAIKYTKNSISIPIWPIYQANTEHDILNTWIRWICYFNEFFLLSIFDSLQLYPSVNVLRIHIFSVPNKFTSHSSVSVCRVFYHLYRWWNRREVVWHKSLFLIHKHENEIRVIFRSPLAL